MTFWDQHGQEVEISQADQKWLDDSYFMTQQMRLEVDAPRAALSYRVSTKGQVDHDDIPMQKIACRKFAQEHGWRVVLEKAEKEISGSKVSASKRDVIQELRSEAGKGNFDILLVYMFDRLGRIESETPFVLEWFVQHGIQMWSTHEGQQRIESHGDKLMNYIRFWQAAGESEKTSMRTRDRIRQIVSSGHFAGGFVPYGYRAINKGRVNKRDQPVKDLEINPDEAEWVREVFMKVAEEGASGYAMAQMLNQRGLRTRQGAEFQSSNIKRMIQHEGYTGYIITKAARSEFMPQLQIIDEALFAKANEMISKSHAHPVRVAWLYRPDSCSYWRNRFLIASIRLTTALWVLYPNLSAISSSVYPSTRSSKIDISFWDRVALNRRQKSSLSTCSVKSPSRAGRE